MKRKHEDHLIENHKEKHEEKHEEKNEEKHDKKHEEKHKDYLTLIKNHDRKT